MINEEILSNPFSLCMINYNGEQYLEESLGSVFSQDVKFEDILLIDNASNDNSLEIVRNKFPDVKIIQLEKNCGAAAARNIGFQRVSCDMVLFMDNDVSLADGCAFQLLKSLDENHNAAAAMPKVVYSSDRNMIQYDGAQSHFLGLMTLHNENQPLVTSINETRKIGSLVTSCFIVDRKKWGDSDPFDETFFLYHEDQDFGYRIRSLGHEILSVSAAVCYHREGTQGLSLRRDGKYSKKRVFYLIRNRWQIILKNYESKTLLLLSPIFIIYEIFQFGGVLKKKWLQEWLKANFWIMLHFNEIIYKRREIQKARLIPDHEILTGGPIPYTGYLLKSPLEKAGKRFLDNITEIYWNGFKKLI